MPILLILAIVSTLADWFAVGTGRLRLRYITKSGALFFLFLWYVSSLPSGSPPLGIRFASALALSLVGDIFLLFEDRHFLKGLVAFLVAHLAYILALNSHGVVLNLETAILAVGVALLAVTILRRIVSALRMGGRDRLVIPVIAYAVMLSLTLWSTLTTHFRPEWPTLAAWLVSFGGLLFFASDAIRTWTQFVTPVPRGRLINIALYHIAQFLMSFSVLFALGSLP